MAFSTVSTPNGRSAYVTNLVVDTDAEIATLPTHYAPGSSCFVISNSTTYMLNHNKEWKLVQNSGGGGGGSADIGLATKEDIDNLFNKPISGTSTINGSLATTEDIDKIFG